MNEAAALQYLELVCLVQQHFQPESAPCTLSKNFLFYFRFLIPHFHLLFNFHLLYLFNSSLSLFIYSLPFTRVCALRTPPKTFLLFNSALLLFILFFPFTRLRALHTVQNFLFHFHFLVPNFLTFTYYSTYTFQFYF